ncbi:hypothetical protein GWI33_020613, partial [Rhynchophorus ferrugineus]
RGASGLLFLNNGIADGKRSGTGTKEEVGEGRNCPPQRPLGTMKARPHPL